VVLTRRVCDHGCTILSLYAESCLPSVNDTRASFLRIPILSPYGVPEPSSSALPPPPSFFPPPPIQDNRPSERSLPHVTPFTPDRTLSAVPGELVATSSHAPGPPPPPLAPCRPPRCAVLSSLRVFPRTFLSTLPTLTVAPRAPPPRVQRTPHGQDQIALNLWLCDSGSRKP